MFAPRTLLLMTLIAAFALPVAVYAEDAAPGEGAPVHTVKKRPKKVVKPVATPVAPVPYTVINPTALPAAAPAPVTPPPPPVVETPVYATVTVKAPPPTEISLKCETRVSEGKKFVSQGVFYIQIFPSAVFPDEQADFKFLFVDPTHKSLIRQTMCQDIACPADVTRSAYGLINRPTRKGSALRITLDRTRGAFYAEDITKGMTGSSHLGESGWCRPEALPKPLF